MDATREQLLAGLDYLAAITELHQRVRAGSPSPVRRSRRPAGAARR